MCSRNNTRGHGWQCTNEARNRAGLFPILSIRRRPLIFLINSSYSHITIHFKPPSQGIVGNTSQKTELNWGIYEACPNWYLPLWGWQNKYIGPLSTTTILNQLTYTSPLPNGLPKHLMSRQRPTISQVISGATPTFWTTAQVCYCCTEEQIHSINAFNPNPAPHSPFINATSDHERRHVML